VLSAAILLRTLVSLVLLGGMPLVSDARDYFECATRLAAGDVGGAFYWPPGEPAVLAGALVALGRSVVVARLVTIAISVATAALASLLTREVAGERAARSAGWIAALYPPAVLLCGQTYAQHLASLCLAATAYFGLTAARRRRLVDFALAGAALGLGCLTRPSMMSVTPVLAVGALFMVRRSRQPALALAAGASLAVLAALVVVVPAVAHNARAGAGWTLSTNNERNLFLGNNPYTPDYKTSHLGQRSLDELDPAARAYLESFYDRPDARVAMRNEALEYIRAHPGRSALRTFNRTTSFWGFDYLMTREIQGWLGAPAPALLPVLALEAGGYFAIAALALLGMIGKAGPAEAGPRAWLLALSLAYEAPYAIAFSGGAYHFPVMPLVIPFAAIAVSRGAAGLKELLACRRAQVALVAFTLLQVQYAWHAVELAG
jgi:4-amino-4-deoxy-L-arabinose transferase-like glycosyltransferase